MCTSLFYPSYISRTSYFYNESRIVPRNLPLASLLIWVEERLVSIDADREGIAVSLEGSAHTHFMCRL